MNNNIKDLQIPVRPVIYTHSSMHRFRRSDISSILLHQHQIPRGLVGFGSIVDQEGRRANSVQTLSWSTDTLVLRVLR